MKTVAIVQARLGSSRLPRKVFADIGGQPMLARVLARTARATSLDAVWVATTDLEEDDAIAAWCAEHGAPFTRGSSQDVLGRYLLAAEESGADVIVRITSDCPLIDPELIDAVVAARAEAGADYAGNAVERTFPDGLDAEAVTLDALKRAGAGATEDFNRLHVTSWIYLHPEKFRMASVTCPENRPEVRWTVDTAEDLALVRELYAAFGNDDRMGWRDVLEVFDRNADMRGLNAHIRPKALEEG